MSRRTSSLSTFTTVPWTIWPSSTSTSVSSIASANDMPRSSAVTWRGVYVPSSAKVPRGASVVDVGESDNRESAFEGNGEWRRADKYPRRRTGNGSTEQAVRRSDGQFRSENEELGGLGRRLPTTVRAG